MSLLDRIFGVKVYTCLECHWKGTPEDWRDHLWGAHGDRWRFGTGYVVRYTVRRVRH